MTYFEVKERLNGLLEFRQLYSEYINFTNRFANPAAKIVRDKMEPLTALTVDSLKRMRLGSIVTKTAPSAGGKNIKINLIMAIFRDKVIRDYNLSDDEPMKILNTGILKYRTRLWQQKIVKNEKVYNRKTKHKDIKDTNHVVYRKSRPRG